MGFKVRPLLRVTNMLYYPNSVVLKKDQNEIQYTGFPPNWKREGTIGNFILAEDSIFSKISIMYIYYF